MLKTASAAIIAGLAFPAYADTDHSTIMGCYASVHSQCYGDGGSGCSEEVYEGGLDECDSSYGNTADARPIWPHQPGGFLAPMSGARFGSFVVPRSPNRR